MSNPETKPPEKLTEEQIHKGLADLKFDWKLTEDSKTITHKFQFKGFYKTMAFVNSVAWIAQQEMHHPDMEVTYNTCTINFTTHDSDGLTANDFRCAQRIEDLNP